MKRSQPLPAAASRAFLSREAPSIGVTKERLRRGDVLHPFRGVNSAHPSGPGVPARARDYAPLLLPGQQFSHTTALALRDVPTVDDGRLHVSVAFPRTPPRGVGIQGHSLQRLTPTELGELIVSSPASAWIESAALVSKEELVALGDALLPARERVGLAALDELVEAADREGVPGLQRAKWALPRIRPGVRARPESHLRLAVVAAGMPEPVIEHPVRVAGGLILHPDLLFLGFGLALEYEGDGHRTDRRQWQLDIQRRELLEAVGIRSMRVTSHDLWVARPALMLRIADHLRRAH